MEQERLFRLSIPGIIFLGTTLLIYSVLGGNIDFLETLFTDSKIAFFIATIITTPVLGIVISTISISLIHLLMGHSFYINNPKPEISNVIFRGQLNKKISLYRYYVKYQAYARIHSKDETIKFLQRRWNFLWIQANNLAAIALGTILGILFKVLLDQVESKYILNKKILWIIVIFLILYVISAFCHIKFLRREILDIEDASIIEIDKYEKENNSNEKKSQ